MERFVELRESSVENEPLWMRMMGPALMPRTPRNAKVGGMQWQIYSTGGWLALLVIVAVFVFIFLKS